MNLMDTHQKKLSEMQLDKLKEMIETLGCTSPTVTLYRGLRTYEEGGVLSIILQVTDKEERL